MSQWGVITCTGRGSSHSEEAPVHRTVAQEHAQAEFDAATRQSAQLALLQGEDAIINRGSAIAGGMFDLPLDAAKAVIQDYRERLADRIEDLAREL